jgi:hypothetical protein
VNNPLAQRELIPGSKHQTPGPHSIKGGLPNILLASLSSILSFSSSRSALLDDNASVFHWILTHLSLAKKPSLASHLFIIFFRQSITNIVAFYSRSRSRSWSTAALAIIIVIIKIQSN